VLIAFFSDDTSLYITIFAIERSTLTLPLKEAF